MALEMNGNHDPVMNGASNASESNTVMPDAPTQMQGISADEIALYDRQIRLWGVKAQENIRSANVLLISVKALGTEIAKNLILNGIGSITVIDHEIVTDDDFGAQYFLREEDLGQNRAKAAEPRLQELNPRVSVTAAESDIRSKLQDFYEPFNIVIACDVDFNTLLQVNSLCRLVTRPFYATGIHGFFGFIFADLIEHEYIIEREQSNVATSINAESATRSIVSVATKKENGKNIEMVTKKELYSHLILSNTSPLPPEYLRNRRKMRSVSPLLPCLRALWEFERQHNRHPDPEAQSELAEYTKLVREKFTELQMPAETMQGDFVKAFVHNLGSEIVPTAAFVGGRLAEDVINVLGKREQPLQNMALFDGESFHGPIYALHPIFSDPAGAIADGNVGTAVIDGNPVGVGVDPVPVSMRIMAGATTNGDTNGGAPIDLS